MHSNTSRNWWKSFFNERYLALISKHITPERTAQEIEFIVQKLRLRKGSRILDLACGQGRHAIELISRGYRVTCFDHSRFLLRIAKQEAEKRGLQIDCVQGDMRKLSYRCSFDAVICMFTSFGYFQKEEDHKKVLKNVARAIKRGGKFFLDTSNIFSTLLYLGERGKMNKDSKTPFIIRKMRRKNVVVEWRETFHSRTSRWETNILWRKGLKQERETYSVRLFTLGEITALLKECGFFVKGVWGDFSGGSYILTSPRMIILAKKK